MGCLSSWLEEQIGYVDSGRSITKSIEVAQYMSSYQAE